MTRNPVSASLRAIPRPKPRLPPVTITLRMATNQLSGFGHSQAGHYIDYRGNFVRRERLAAKQQDFVLEFRNGVSGGARGCVQDHVGHDKRAGDWIFLCPDE